MGPFDLSAVCCEVSGITCAGRSFFEIWCEWKGKRLAREFMSHPRVTVTLGRGGKRVFFFFSLTLLHICSCSGNGSGLEGW